jgi:tetratricopeptide (TPR) repeat protein
VHRDQGDLAGALKSYRDSFAIAEKLAKKDPSNARWQGDLSSSLEKIGDVLGDQGDLAGALKSYYNSLNIRQKLAEKDSSNGIWRSNLSRSFDKIGDMLGGEVDLAPALKNYRDAVVIREKLANQDPTNAEWQADLAHSYFHVCIILVKVTPPAAQEGRAMAEKGRDILRDLRKRKALTAEQQKWLTEIETELGKANKSR